MSIRIRSAPLWGFFAVVTALYWLQVTSERLPTWVRPLVDGFGGNVTVTLVFFFVTLWLDRQTGRQIDQIHQLTANSERILARSDRLLMNERAIQRFEDFLRKESYHNVRFPEIKPSQDSLGLEYVIESVRDDAGEPRKHETEMETLWVVKVREPAHWEVLTPEQRAEYDASPIREGEFYFCGFFNDSWHMSVGTVMSYPQRFYLSGKTGPVYHGEDANQFMSELVDPFRNMTKVTSILVDFVDGSTAVRSGGADVCDIYKDQAGTLFVGVSGSPPKKLYLTNVSRSYEMNEWGELMIEGIRGRATGEKLANIKSAIIKRLAQLQVEIPKVPWWESENYANERW